MTTTWGNALVGTLLAGALAGCANQSVHSPLHTSFEDLSSKVMTRDGDKLEFDSAVNINGLARILAIGDRVYYPGQGLSDHYSIAFSPDCTTYRDRSTFSLNVDKPATPEGVVKEVRDAYLAARTALIEAAGAEVKLLVGQLGLARAKSQSGVDALNSALRLQGVAIRADASDSEKLTALELSLEQIEKSVSDKRSTAAGKREALSKAIDRPGLILTRWSTSREKHGGASVGSIVSGDARRQEGVTGIVVLGDIRVSTLRFGYDYIAYVLRTPVPEFELELGLTTLVVEAKYLAYEQDLDYSKALETALSLTPADVAALGSDAVGLLKQQELKFGYGLSELASIGNSGFLGSPKLDRLPLGDSVIARNTFRDSLVSQKGRALEPPAVTNVEPFMKGQFLEKRGANEGDYIQVYSVRARGFGILDGISRVVHEKPLADVLMELRQERKLGHNAKRAEYIGNLARICPASEQVKASENSNVMKSTEASAPAGASKR